MTAPLQAPGLAAAEVAQSDIVYASEMFVVRFVPASNSDVCVVTFDSYNDERSLSREGFAERYLRSKGISAVHVISRDNDWYQYRDLHVAMDLVRAVTHQFARVVTYGTSMGGYAAIRFADMVGAQAVIALSPQYSIDPTKVPFENRWIADARRIEFLPALDGPITTKADVVVAFDPKSSDARHVELIAADIALRLVRVSYAGHSVPAMLNESKLLDQLVQRVLADKLDASALEREVRHRRRELAIYFAELANRQPPHRRKLAILLARRAAELSPSHDIALRSLADRLSDDSQFAEAIEIYESLLQRGQYQLHYMLPFSKVLAASGQYERATQIVDDILRRWDANAGAHYWMSHLLEKQSQFERALFHARRAAELEPMQPVYKKTARLLVGKVGTSRSRAAVERVLRFFAPRRTPG